MASEGHSKSSSKSSKSKTTKALVLTGFGGYEKIRYEDRPYPKSPKSGELLVKIRASGVNFAEVSMRQGVYRPLPDLPAILGLEASGDVLKVGSDVKDFKVGDKVVCINNLGLWAEHVLIPADQCSIIPDGMTYEEAAALPVNYITAYHILFEFGNLRKGQSVFIHMAAGGVGMAATQLARTVPDVIVYGTASRSKHDVIKKNGVNHPIDYRTLDYAEEIRKIDSEGVDIVMDPLSGKDSMKGFDLLKPLGKVIHFGAANAITGTSRSYWSLLKTYISLKNFNSLQMIDKNKAICGYNLGRLADKPHIVKAGMENVLQLYKEGKIKPHIDSVWAFQDIGLAMKRMQERENIGKVIISTDKEPQQSAQK